MDFVGNDIAYAAGETSWQSCGEFSYCLVTNSHSDSICYGCDSCSALRMPQTSRRHMQVHCGELQVLDLGQGGRHLLLQVLGLWIPEEEWNCLRGSLLSQSAGVGGVLSCLLTLSRNFLLNHESNLRQIQFPLIIS